MIHDTELNQAKTKSVSSILFWLLILVIIVVPTSLSRWPETGFLPIYGLHITLFVLALSLLFFSSRVPTKVAEIVAIGLCLISGLSSTISFGLSLPGGSMFIIILLIASIHWRRKFIYIISSIYLVALVIIGYLYTTGRLEPATDLNQMTSNPMTWVSLILLLSIPGFVSLNAILKLFETKTRLLEEIAQQKLQIEHLANHDNLTGLPTKRLAEDRLDMALKLSNRKNSKTTLLFLDLDGFKQVNDEFGHDAGDIVLKGIANKLLTETRTTDTCCRIGGDEFLVVVPDTDDTSVAIKICQRLIKRISQPVLYDGHSLVVGVSIGGAVYPDHADDADSLKKKADEMMYQVKKSGKNNFLLHL